MDVYKNQPKKILDYLKKTRDEYIKWGYSIEDYENHYELMIKLGINPRTFHCLMRAGINTVESLKKFYYQEGELGLLRLRNVGKKTVQDIQDGMVRAGIDLAVKNPRIYCHFCGHRLKQAEINIYGQEAD